MQVTPLPVLTLTFVLIGNTLLVSNFWKANWRNKEEFSLEKGEGPPFLRKLVGWIPLSFPSLFLFRKDGQKSVLLQIPPSSPFYIYKKNFLPVLFSLLPISLLPPLEKEKINGLNLSSKRRREREAQKSVRPVKSFFPYYSNVSCWLELW